MNMTARPGTAVSRISVKLMLQFALRFVFRDAQQIWPRVVLPMLAGGLALYGALYLYLLEYESYLVGPNERVASLVLGVATAGLLVTLFCHSITTAAITSLALDRDDRGWKYFCVSRRAWRTYAAYLRFLLICAAFIATVALVRNAIRLVFSGPALGLFADVGLLIGLAILAVRAGFLAAPLAAANEAGRVVREAWRLSSHHFWKLAASMFMIALPGFGIEAICEWIVRIAGLAPLAGQGTAPSEFVANYRESLPGVLLAIGLAYVPSVVLLVSASAAAYRQITEPRQQ